MALFAGWVVGGGGHVLLRSKSAIRLRSVLTVLSRACDPSTSRSGAGCWSTLSMMAVAIRAGSPTARPLAGSSIFSNERAGVPT